MKIKIVLFCTYLCDFLHKSALLWLSYWTMLQTPAFHLYLILKQGRKDCGAYLCCNQFENFRLYVTISNIIDYFRFF